MHFFMHITRFFLLILFVIMMATPARALDVTVKVSSFKVDFGFEFAPENLLDSDTTTAWVGGGIGPGVGQWIDLIFGFPVRVERLGIYNGHQAEGRFKEFRRIRSGRIVYPDGTETAFWLRDESGEQVIKCQGKPAKSLRIVIDDVFPKGKNTATVKLAVSEIKLYLTLMGQPGAIRDVQPDPSHVPALPPVDPDKMVPDEIISLLKLFYVKSTALADDYETLFAEDVRDRHDFRFEVLKEVQRQRGTYRLLRTAEVDTSGLGFELVRLEGSWAEVRVFGAYRVKVADLDQNLEEDSVFVLSRGTDGWQIVELDGQEKDF
ncbi:MAG: hypothetical protein JEY79_12720 [Pseudodesulfovibrio sp.]|nr:hypothetical protein [Pseudodesulfovibrio sp.]